MCDIANVPCVNALFIGDYENDRSLIHRIFSSFGWRLIEAHDRRTALLGLRRNPVQVVIAEADLPNWGWKEVLEDLRTFEPTPQLIVTSRTADDYLWSEVLNIGGFDVLPRPFDTDEVERVIAAARRHFDMKPVRSVQQPAAVAVGAA